MISPNPNNTITGRVQRYLTRKRDDREGNNDRKMGFDSSINSLYAQLVTRNHKFRENMMARDRIKSEDSYFESDAFSDQISTNSTFKYLTL